MNPLPRYPLEPVSEAARLLSRNIAPLNESELARVLGVARRTVFAYAQQGIPEDAADRLAVAVGRVPYELWPEWLERSNELAAEEAEKDRLKAEVAENRRREQSRESSRRYRERHPERAKESTAAWRQRNRDAYRSNTHWWAKNNPERKRALSLASQRLRAVDRNRRRRERYAADEAHRESRKASSREQYRQRVAS